MLKNLSYATLINRLSKSERKSWFHVHTTSKRMERERPGYSGFEANLTSFKS